VSRPCRFVFFVCPSVEAFGIRIADLIRQRRPFWQALGGRLASMFRFEFPFLCYVTLLASSAVLWSMLDSIFQFSCCSRGPELSPASDSPRKMLQKSGRGCSCGSQNIDSRPESSSEHMNPIRMNCRASPLHLEGLGAPARSRNITHFSGSR
jgi:hypothetical protein